MGSINKDSMDINWPLIETYYNTLANSGSQWYAFTSGSLSGSSASYVLNWNGRTGTNLMGITLAAGVGNITTAVAKVVGIYNYTASAGATGSTTGLSWLRNLPVYTYGGASLFLSGGDPSLPWDLFYLTYAKRLLGASLPDFPTATEIWNNWPISSPNYFGVGYGTHSNINRSGTDEGGYAINKDLAFMYGLLMTAQINGETSFFSTAKGFLDAWYSKFPNMTDEEPIDNPAYDYNITRTYLQCLLIHELYKLGQITDSALTNTYLPKLYNRVSWLETGSWGPNDSSRQMVGLEVLYNNLSGSSTIPDPLVGVTVADHVGYFNTGSSGSTQNLHSWDAICRAFGQWGIIVKYTVPLAVGSTISIISKTLSGSLILTPTNISLNQTGSGISPGGTWSPTVATTPSNYWYIRIQTGSI